MGVFQILKNQGRFGWFGLNFWCFGTSLGSKILGICGYLIYRGSGGLSLGLGVVVEMVVVFLRLF